MGALNTTPASLSPGAAKTNPISAPVVDRGDLVAFCRVLLATVGIGDVLKIVNLSLVNQEVNPHGPNQRIAPAELIKAPKVVKVLKEASPDVRPEEPQVQHFRIVPVVALH